MSLIAAMRRQAAAPPEAPGPLPAMAYGLLDGAPDPYGPDVLVFGDWRPGGAVVVSD